MRHLRLGYIMLAVVLAMGLGGMLSVVLGGSRIASAEVYLHAESVSMAHPLPSVEPAALKMLQEGHKEIALIVVLRSNRNSPPVPVNQTAYDRRAWRESFVTAQVEVFNQSRARIAPLLQQAEESGDLLSMRDLWLVNGMALKVRPPLFHALAASPEVEALYLDHYVQYLHPERDLVEPVTQTSTQSLLSISESAWGIEKIQVPRMRTTFDVSGSGAVVAIMDTGVDYLHPALRDNYRGNLGKGLYQHVYAWYDAVNEGIYPYDDQGHGTHVAGTAVGALNMGVAPGAKWVGVKVLDTKGYGYDSWIMHGFQWLLAPAGDPSRAPDVVNASWSSPNASNTIFVSIVDTMRDAGIFVVFAAGNEGPNAGSVGAPASYRGVFAVGASDADDETAYFSGRGPSPWGEIKPVVVAPGVNILSSMPGGIYGSHSGTSMATPHVAGLAAILRGVSQTLSVRELTRIITETSVPLSKTVPNNESGWGRIDAFEAVIRVVQPAIVEGTVRDFRGHGLAGAWVTAQSVLTPEQRAQTSADASGNYTLALSPGRYDIVADAFGNYPQSRLGLDLPAGAPTRLDFTLLPQPAGVLVGYVEISGTGQPVTEALHIALADTPLTATTSVTGMVRVVAPQGTYSLVVREVGYRLVEMPVTVTAGKTTEVDILLTPAPRLVLVDEGAWYYGSRIDYWAESLDGLRYAYDVQTIKHPQTDAPGAEMLLDYDIVLWSSPSGSPGLVGAADALTLYLNAGGRLLVSGQDVAYFDAGGTLDVGPQTYLQQQLGVSYIGERTIPGEIQGQGSFQGLVVDVQSEDGADNQRDPDVVVITDPDLADYSWRFSDGAGAGSAVDICTPYKALYFGFGFEAIGGQSQRQEVMRRSLDWLATAPLTEGLAFLNAGAATQIGTAGSTLTHTLYLRHIGLLGGIEYISLTAQGGNWPYAIIPSNVEISPCQVITAQVVVTIPQETALHVTDRLTLTALSTQSNASVTLSLSTKTPAPVLLVDDDRWYPVETLYRQALDSAGLLYDIWDNADSAGGIPGCRSPLTETLTPYPVIVWFTGYDWYRPLIDVEMRRLLSYLDQGGRLLLSSQDYLYYHAADSLTRRLGVQAYTEDQEILSVRTAGHPSSGVWPLISLDYPFPSHTDVVEPVPAASVVFRDQADQPVGIAAVEEGTGVPQSLFFGVPLAALPLSVRTDTLARGVGWLSPLGRSQWYVAPASASPGETLAYTLALRNDAKEVHQVAMKHFIPAGQVLKVASLPPAVTYQASSESLSWEGSLSPAEVVTYSWETLLTSLPAAPSYPTVTLSLAAWGLTFERFAPFYGEDVNLSATAWLSSAHSHLPAGTPVTLSLLLHNEANHGGAVRVEAWLMEGLSPITATAFLTESPHGWSLPWWQGYLGAGERYTLTLPVQAWAWQEPVRVDALLSNDQGDRWDRSLWLNVIVNSFYLPLLTR